MLCSRGETPAYSRQVRSESSTGLRPACGVSVIRCLAPGIWPDENVTLVRKKVKPRSEQLLAYCASGHVAALIFLESSSHYLLKPRAGSVVRLLHGLWVAGPRFGEEGKRSEIFRDMTRVASLSQARPAPQPTCIYSAPVLGYPRRYLLSG